MRIQILNSFRGDDEKEIDTSSEDGRAQAAKLVGELLKSGSAVFLEKEIAGTMHTYRVVGYDPATNKLTIRLDASAKDPDVTPNKNSGRKGRKFGSYRGRRRTGTIDPDTGKMVSVAPVSGGCDGK